MTSDSASRVTHSRRSLAFVIALFAGGIVAVTAFGDDETPPPGATAPAATTPAPANGPATAPAAPRPPADAKPSPAAGAGRGTASGQSQEHFEPTEKVRADFDVSFPVDI